MMAWLNDNSTVAYRPLGIPQDEELDIYLHSYSFTIEYEKFPIEVEKKQDRRKEIKANGQKQMRLKPEQSEIKLILTFGVQIQLNEIMSIILKVKREVKTTGCYDGFVTLDPEKVAFYQEVQGSNQVCLHGNLGEIMKEHLEHDIYKLYKNDANKNKFYVKVEVHFYASAAMTVDSRTFSVRSEKKSSGVKRRRFSDSTGSSLSEAPPSLTDLHNTKGFQHAQEASKMVVDEIEAKFGRFDNVHAKVIKSGNGDIAYHFILKEQDSSEKYEPGETIGFTTNEEGKVVIQKLTSCMDVFLKGVVTENQYIEANKPEDDSVITATICMLGVVPVLTIGPVYPGDGLFASPDIPGIATPQDYVGCQKKDTLLGFSLEKDDCPDDEIHEVQALVSMLGGASQELVTRDLLNLENNLKDNISASSYRHKKRYCFLSILIVLFSVALGLGVYQRYGIGTMYQRWDCSRGSTGTSEYWYWLQGHLYRGVSFPDCKTVWRKATQDRRFYRRPKRNQDFTMKEKCLKNGTYHYYINLDSCTGVLNPGARYMYAVDDNCTKVYLFNEVEGEWVVDRKVCASPRCNLFCSHKTFNGGDDKCDPNAICKHDDQKQTCDDDEQ